MKKRFRDEGLGFRALNPKAPDGAEEELKRASKDRRFGCIYCECLELGFRVKFRAVEGSGWWHV